MEVDSIVRKAEAKLAQRKRQEDALRKTEHALKALCKEYDMATGCRGTTPVHLQKVVAGVSPLPQAARG